MKMPKQWYLWGPKTKEGKEQGRNSSIPKPKPKSKPPPAMAAAGGCMAAILQLFKSHHLQFRLHYTNSHYPRFDTAEDNKAPRTSLEVEEVGVDTTPLVMSLLSKTEQEANAESSIPVELGRLDTKLRTVQVRSLKTEDVVSSSESNTPSLVARLMGLDPLPDLSNQNGRLSLQVSRPKRVELRRHSCSENPNPRPKQRSCEYRRSVMEGVKGREFGVDITNGTGERQGKGKGKRRRDLQMLSIKRNTSENCNAKKRFNHPSSVNVRKEKEESNLRSSNARGKEKARNKAPGGQSGRRNTNINARTSSRELKPRSINSDHPQLFRAGRATPRKGSTPDHLKLIFNLRSTRPPPPPAFKGSTLLHHRLVGLDPFLGCEHEKTQIVEDIEREMIHSLLLDTLAALGFVL